MQLLQYEVICSHFMTPHICLSRRVLNTWRGIKAGVKLSGRTCYSYWFSCYFDQSGKLMKAMHLPESEYSTLVFFFLKGVGI
jgi:hypothetical protein